jgi:glyoxylase-like metal-dependent hydrolase (beta-lactamase superfamily II)
VVDIVERVNRSREAGPVKTSMARRRIRRLSAVAFGALVLVLAVATESCAALGGRASGSRRERMRQSPEWNGSHFENPQPLINDLVASVITLVKTDANVTPKSPPSTVSVEPGRFAVPPPSGLRVTWLGHSTILLEIDGHRFLTDPVWSERVGPVGFMGPKRWFPPLIALKDLPPLDAVILSHDHYDHLDYATIVALKDRVTFIAPLGVGAHLERWGVPADRIVELDWWDTCAFGNLTLWAVPARHASGRELFVDNGAKLWAGYAFLGARHRVYYSGRTAAEYPIRADHAD